MFSLELFFPPQTVPEDYSMPLNYAQIILFELSNDSGCLGRIAFIDDCIFHTNAVFNKHKTNIWGLEKPC